MANPTTIIASILEKFFDYFISPLLNRIIAIIVSFFTGILHLFTAIEGFSAPFGLILAVMLFFASYIIYVRYW